MPLGNYRKMPVMLGQSLHSAKASTMGKGGRGMLDGFLNSTPVHNIRDMGIDIFGKIGGKVKEKLGKKAEDLVGGALDKMLGKL